MADKRLAGASIAFGVLALVAGGLQAWAFVSSQQSRHAVLPLFAFSVGVCVVIAGARAFVRAKKHSREGPDPEVDPDRAEKPGQHGSRWAP